MDNSATILRTDPNLLKALEKAASKKLTPSEIFEQRVSFVFGSIDSKSGITRERVKQVIRDQEGDSGTKQ